MRKLFISLLIFIFSTSLVYAQPSASYDTADQISTDTTNFTGDGNLSSADDTVQKALETLDGLTGAKGWNIDGANVHTTDTIANVGIGTSIPEYTLDVSGDINADAINVNGTRVCVQGDSTCLPPAGGWTDTGTNIFTTTLTRNVGIGTATPEAKLHVAGGAIFDGSFSGMILQNGFKINGGTTRKFIIEQTGGTHDSNLRVDMDSVEGVASVDSSSATPIDTLQLVDIDFETNGTVTASSFIGDGSALTGIGASASGWTDSGTNIYNTATSDRVAIGTTSPITGSKLHVVGTISATSFVGDGSGLTGISGGSGDGINWSSYDDITALAQTDEFLVNNGGTNKSINWYSVENILPVPNGFDGAVDFNPANREAIYVATTPETSVYDSTTANAPFTFGCTFFARSNGRSTLGTMIDKGLGENTGKGYHMHLYAGNSTTAKIGTNVGHNDNDADKATAADGPANGSVTLNKWTRGIATYNEDNDKKMKTYVDGAEISYASNTAGTGNVSDDTALNLYIGNKKDGSVTFDGPIKDCFVMHGKAMTAAEVLEDYRGTLANGITARWDFSEGGGRYIKEFYSGAFALTGTIASSVFSAGDLPWVSPAMTLYGGNFSIGTTTPSAQAHIVNITTSSSFRVDDSLADNSPFIITSAGNTGIGTFAPSTNLHVVGGLRATGLASCDTIDTDSNGVFSCGTDDSSGAGSSGWTDGGTDVYLSTTSDMVGVGTTTPNAQLMISNVGTEASFRVDDSLIDASPFLINSVGNVGIGTTTASGKLTIGSTGQFSVDGSGNFSTSSTTGSIDVFNISNSSITSGNVIDATSSSSSQTVPLVSFTQSGASSGGTLRVNQSSGSSTGIPLWVTNAGTNKGVLIEDVASDTTPFVILADGNTGIGTHSPVQKLEVIGTVQATYFVGDGSGLTGISGGGSVGIGTANTITFWPTTTTVGSLPTGTYPSLTELSYVKGATSNIQTQINGIGASGWTDGTAVIYTTTSTDNVGIGTFNPLERLQVVGTVQATTFVTNSTSAGSLVLNEASANGSNTITISAPSSVASDRSCALEDDSTPFDNCVSATSSGWTDAGATINVTTSTDNVGIGTSSPEKKLVLAGADSDMRIKSTTSSVHGELQFFSDLGESFNIGVGGSTTSPASEAFFENVISGAPTNFISNGGVFGFNGGPVRYVPTDSPPTCNSGLKGGTYYDDSLSELCDCDGTSWAQVDGGGAC